MKKVSARQANHDFSKLLSWVERGEEILITKRSKPVAQGLSWGTDVRAFTRDEMHER